MPKVSVIMGVYNCGSTVAEAIDSILSQTYTDWEMIICDDASTDNTYEIVRSYVDKYPNKIILLKNENNVGLNITLNNCIAQAQGEYLARMDADDISLPTRFEKEVKFLDTHSDFALVSSSYILFDEEKEWGHDNAKKAPTKQDFINNITCFCHPATMMRRSAMLDVGCYSIERVFLRYEDCNLWHKMYGKGYKGYNIQEYLYKYRENAETLARRTLKHRINGAKVKYIGFKLMDIPKKYYYAIVIRFAKDLILGIVPRRVYTFLHKSRIEKKG